MINIKNLLLVVITLTAQFAHAKDANAVKTIKLQSTGMPTEPKTGRLTNPYVKTADTGILYSKNSANEVIKVGEHYADNVNELLSSTAKFVHLLSYHNGLNKGGGYFRYNSTQTADNHNGGTVLCKSKSYPTNWDIKIQRVAWYQAGVITDTGCYELINSVGLLKVTNFGTKSDGTTIDTLGVKANVAYYTALGGSEKANGRYTIANSVIFPDGDGTTIDDTIFIEKSSIVIRGESPASTVIFPNANKNIFEFKAGALSLYGNGIHDLRIHAPGNAKAGAALKLYHTINFMSSNIMVNGSHIALHADGIGRTFFDGFLSTQELRSAGTGSYGFLLSGTDRQNGDVYMDGFNAFYPIDNMPDFSMRFESADGVYLSNLHIQGGWEFEPIGEGKKVLASIECVNCYLDVANEDNLNFKGNSAAYRNFFFTNTFLAGSKNGLRVENGKSVIENIKLTSGKIYGMKQKGVSIERSAAKDISINDIQFNGNNSDNIATGGDIYSKGDSTRVNSSTFKLGGVKGTAIKFDSGALNSQIIGGDISDSTAGTKVTSISSTNKIVALSGFINKNSGSATLLKGTTSVTVFHGIDLGAHAEVNFYDIQITPRSSLAGCGSLYVRNYTNTTFDILCDTAPASKLYINWKLDTE